MTQERPGDPAADPADGRDDAAEAVRAARLHHRQGAQLMRLGRGREAIAAFARALELSPELGGVWYELGMAQIGEGEVEAARASLIRAAERLPDRPEPLGQLAVLAARRGDWDEVRRLAEAALALDPVLASAIRALAQAELQAGRTDAAAARVEAWLARGVEPGPARRLALGLLGDIRERQGRYDEAFVLYAQGNAETQRQQAPRFGRSDLTATLDGLRTQARASGAQPWRPQGAEAPSLCTTHVFLMGFMRSGTTLLEQALAARDDVATLEEQEALTSGVQAYLGDPQGLARLRDADPQTLSKHRADYWARVRGFGVAPEGKVFVDKNPFNGVKLPLIWRLFPEAKIVFSLRQPQDVVLSCFRHRFAVNSYTYELLDLGRAARFYDSYMRLVQAYLEVLPKDLLHLYRHEDLVADFPAALGRICEHLGLDLRAEMFDVGARVRAGRVSSPSAVQLRDGLNRDGLQSWRRYAAPLGAIQPILEPWSQTFGYSGGADRTPSFNP